MSYLKPWFEISSHEVDFLVKSYFYDYSDSLPRDLLLFAGERWWLILCGIEREIKDLTSSIDHINDLA